MVKITQLIKQIRAKTSTFNRFQELFWNNKVSIYILAIQWRHQTAMGRKSLHDYILTKLAYIGEMAGDSSRRCHGWANQMGTPPMSLAPFKVAIRGRGTQFSWLMTYRIHC